ncbi:MAG: DAK2 domain-containing protein [Planifilum sp.]|jgi:DAK2 domain fusion protein YloV
MIHGGARLLQQNEEQVNALNVFPVPDGDTGTNMNLTLSSGVREMDKVSSSTRVGDLAEALSKGLLMGARGNSGVILSQLFRGFAKAVSEKETIDARDLAEAFKKGVDMAYKAVMKPVEGTILTVSREAADRGMIRSRQTDDPAEVMAEVLSGAQQSLEKTPQLLPILAETNVVDAGGQGLVYILEGFLAALRGEGISEEAGGDLSAPEAERSLAAVAHGETAQSRIDPATIEHGYCTEFIIRLQGRRTFDEGDFREEMGAFGDSLLVVADEGLVKVHIHSERPGDALNFAQEFGDLTNIKIENMREQHAQWAGTEAPAKREGAAPAEPAVKEQKPYGIVAVASGDGIVEMFRSLGAEAVIEGGQTMNPSTEDIVKAIQDLSADHVFVLPNNKNIFMAAEQAAELVDVPVTVLPTRTVLQGLTALIAFDPEAEAERNREKMEEALKGVLCGEVTYAVRDSQVNGHSIKEGDFLGIFEGKIETVGGSLIATSRDLLQKMLARGGDLVTILYGKDVTDAQVKELSDFLERNYPDVESEIHYGGQPLYFFLITIE